MKLHVDGDALQWNNEIVVEMWMKIQGYLILMVNSRERISTYFHVYENQKNNDDFTIVGVDRMICLHVL